MSTAVTTIGPADHGRAMTLEEFARADFEPGAVYELGRGVVAVIDVPNPRHLLVVDAVRRQLEAHRTQNPDAFHCLASGSDCRILLQDLQSERHPDIALYHTPPPANDETAWSSWVPELLVEVVSPASRTRDYDEKPDEYLKFGVKEYWIVDPKERKLVVLQRAGGVWAENTIHPPQTHRTHLLPGFTFETEPVFAAAK